MILRSAKYSELFEKCIGKTARLSIPYLMLSALFTDIFISCIFSFLLFPDHTEGPDLKTTVEDFILSVVAVPVIETWIIQSWLIKIILKYSHNNKLAAVVFSAIVFGLGHHYSIPYIIKAFISGCIYGILYFSIAGKQKNPFPYIVLTHSTYNLIGFILNSL